MHNKEMNRYGPTPLPLHLSLAASACMQQGEDGQAMMQDLLAGIKAYQDHPYKRQEGGLPVLWQQEEATLSGDEIQKGRPHLMCIPSLINRSSILDITPERSFLRFMRDEEKLGISLLDWGESARDDGQGSPEDLILKRLIPALENPGTPVHVLGYCIGGTLLLAAAQLRPDLFASITLLASPWDFHAGDPSMRLLVQTASPGAFTMMAQQGKLGGLWTQSLFAALEPEKTARKFASFAARAPEDPEAAVFVAVEDWLNDPVDLPGGIARTCIQDWYGLNGPAKGQWKVGKTVIDPAKINCPVLIVTGARDKLVPPESSTVLQHIVPGAKLLQEDFGHIGLMASKAAPQQIWQPIKNWILAQD